MGLPALRREPRQVESRPRLTLVKKQSPSRKRSKKASLALAQRNFRLFAALTVLTAVLGVGRVWLSVQATELSFEANQLKKEIKSERYEGDMLEVRQSALGSPSRIRAIAGSAMDMAPADTVTYLDLTEKKKPQAKATAPTTRAESGLSVALSRIMDLTAGEAQVLLVGDVGLASTP